MLPAVYGTCNQQGGGGVSLAAAISDVSNDTDGYNVNCGDVDFIVINGVYTYSLSVGRGNYTVVGGTPPYTITWTFTTSSPKIDLITTLASGDPGEFTAEAQAFGPLGAVDILLDVEDDDGTTTSATCSMDIEGII